MRKAIFSLSIMLFACVGLIHAQTVFKKYGFNKTPLTLSQGKYNEFFTNEEVVQIGTIRLNTRTNKVIEFLEEDTTKINYKSEFSGRWLSVDPLAENTPNYSPYAYCKNNPVVYVDPDGRQSEWFFEFGPILERQAIRDGIYKDDGSFPSMQNAVQHSDRPAQAAQIEAYKQVGLFGLWEVGGAIFNVARPFFAESRILKLTGGLFKSPAVYQAINNVDKFVASSLRTYKNGSTIIGKAFQKHTSREGGVFSMLKHSGKTETQDGMKVMKEILNSDKQLIDQEVNGTKTIYDKVTGRGVNVNRQGEFGGFRELPERNVADVKKVLKND